MTYFPEQPSSLSGRNHHVNVRMNGATRAAAALLSMCAVLAFTTPASADPKACTTAHASGQRESKAGHLRLATQLYTKCGSDESCPEEIKRECTELLQAVRQVVPTVIFSIVDDGKRDVSNVKVFSTDELVADGLDGRAVEIDPGKHHLRFLLPWGEVLSTDVLIREGEKSRMIRMEVGKGAVADGGGQERPSSAPSEQQTGTRTYTPAWIAAGVGGVALVTGVTMSVLGNSKKSDLDACKPNCSTSQQGVYDNAKTMFLVGDISFGVAAVSAAVATWLFLSPPTVESGTKNAAAVKNPNTPRFLSIGGAPTVGGAQVGVSGEF